MLLELCLFIKGFVFKPMAMARLVFISSAVLCSRLRGARTIELFSVEPTMALIGESDGRLSLSRGPLRISSLNMDESSDYLAIDCILRSPPGIANT